MKTRHHEVDAQKYVKRDEKLSQHGEKERSLVLHHAFQLHFKKTKIKPYCFHKKFLLFLNRPV